MMKNNRDNKQENTRVMGRVKFYNREKGFGFITCNDDGKDYYVGQKMVGEEGYLTKGSLVEFEVRHGRGNDLTYAANVLVVEVPGE